MAPVSKSYCTGTFTKRAPTGGYYRWRGCQQGGRCVAVKNVVIMESSYVDVPRSVRGVWAAKTRDYGLTYIQSVS